MSSADDLPPWATALMAFDRYIRPDPGEDEFITDIEALIKDGGFSGLFTFAPLSTTKSSIEVMFERRSGEALLLWDTDCLDRLDGLLAFCLAEDLKHSKASASSPSRISPLDLFYGPISRSRLKS